MRRLSKLTVVAVVVPLVGVLFAIGYGCGWSQPPLLGDNDAGNNPNIGVHTGACTVDGQTISCDVETGRSGNVVNCFNGTQTCTNGQWGPCGGGTSGSMSTVVIGGGNTTIETVTPGDASSSSSGCINNPCDPYCLGIDVDAGTLVPDGGFGPPTIFGTLIGYSSWPPGKQNAMSLIPGWCKMTIPEPDSGPYAYDECNYDYCCGTPDGGGEAGTCQQWIAQPEAGVCVAPPVGVKDYTVGVGCTDTSGNVHIPVCNRGTVDANTGAVILIDWTANPNSAGTPAICQVPTTGSYKGKCTIDLTVKPIKASKCVDVDVTVPGTGITCDTGLFGGGNHTSMVNPPTGTYGTAYTQRNEDDICNNQSFVYTTSGTCSAYGAQPPLPALSSYTYIAVCPSGFAPQWNQFTYNTAVPVQSDVLFTATTQAILVDGGMGAATSSVQLADPGVVGTDPAVCPISGPSPCPKNLTTLLGTASTNAVLNLSVTLTSTTSIATVNSWSVTFNCLPNQ